MYKRKFKEETISATTEFNTNDPSDEEVLRIAITSELSAINLYQQLARKTSNNKIARVLIDIAKEEKVHIGEFEEMLNSIDHEQVRSNIEGRNEVQEI
jgi:rubrerythrin